MKPGKHQRSKQRCQDLCWKVHDTAQSFILRQILCMNYVINTSLLVSSSVRNKQLLCSVQCQGQNREQKQSYSKDLCWVLFHSLFYYVITQFLTFFRTIYTPIIYLKSHSIVNFRKLIFTYTSIWYYEITKILRALSLVDSCVFDESMQTRLCLVRAWTNDKCLATKVHQTLFGDQTC